MSKFGCSFCFVITFLTFVVRFFGHGSTLAETSRRMTFNKQQVSQNRVPFPLSLIIYYGIMIYCYLCMLLQLRFACLLVSKASWGQNRSQARHEVCRSHYYMDKILMDSKGSQYYVECVWNMLNSLFTFGGNIPALVMAFWRLSSRPNDQGTASTHTTINSELY